MMLLLEVVVEVENEELLRCSERDLARDSAILLTCVVGLRLFD